MIGLRRLARALHDQDGLTLPELVVAASLLVVVVALFLSVLNAVQNTVAGQQRRSDTNDELRLAIERIDREIRSGNVFSDPSTETPPYYGMRVFTQSNATPSEPNRCVQYRIASRRLERRTWPPTFGATPDPATVGGWSQVAGGIVNVDENVHAFEASITLGSTVRTVDITLVGNQRYDSHASETARISISATGRNTTFNYPSDACDPVPA